MHPLEYGLTKESISEAPTIHPVMLTGFINAVGMNPLRLNKRTRRSPYGPLLKM